ncbi:RES family NAD+ phosphorylase [Vibrio salinus]|uniref:RES family NAD+ phosphorylase n=1 Tax=Vibrio salinus TaxID=2899784 RepID=UPI001E3FF83D|nr:RES family NAD+ phosphorylase [Vibrio salinus]MCE0493071.1 RES family NAD+ phosphorylase [Vibrio salinus]
MGINNHPEKRKGYRLINTRYPCIALFDDVATPEEFDILYAIQAITNPRLKEEIGDLSLLRHSEIPFQCQRGRSYAVAPFTHINPDGGRFNDCFFGALYIASNDQTAAAEVRYHQQKYWSKIEGLKYDRFLFRGLIVTHHSSPTYIVHSDNHDVLNPDSYAVSQHLARDLKKNGYQAIQYPSVRTDGGECWALLTPESVDDIVQTYLLEMIWDGEKIAEVNRVNNVET